MPLIILFIVFIVAALWFLGAIQSIRLRYEFDEYGIRIIDRGFFKIEVAYLRFNLMSRITILPTWKVFPVMFIPWLSFGWRWWQSEAVILRMKAGTFRWLILTPENIESFIETISGRLPQGSVIERRVSARNTTNA